MLVFLTVILIALCSYFIFQWNKEKTESKYLNSVKEQMVFKNFTYLTKELYGIATTLNKYDDGFTEKEMDLFKHSLDKDIRMLNETGMSLSYLYSPTSLDGIYEHYIWRTEEMLGKIKEGKISDEKEIHLIGNVIKKQNKQLSDMFYGEEQVGVEGINKKEGFMKVIEIFDLMNKEIGEIVNK